MSAEELYSIKMRASKKENGTDVHISGAEKIVEAPDVDIFANALIERGMHHSKGEADALNLKINKVCKENIIYLDALSVETIEVETWEKGQEEIKKYLKETSISSEYRIRKDHTLFFLKPCECLLHIKMLLIVRFVSSLWCLFL